MIDVLRKIFDLLNPRERRNLMLLVGLMLVMGVFDVLGVASVLPFLAVVANPEMVETNRYLAAAYEFSGVTGVWKFVILLGVAAFLFVVVNNAIRAFTLYATTRFTKMRVVSLSMNLMARYLGQPYLWFLTRHSSDLGKTVLTEVAQVVNGPMTAAMQFVAQSVVVTFLLVFLLVLEPTAALGAAVLFGISYGLIFLVARRKLARMGEERVKANRERFQILQEAMSGIKSVKLMDLERSYLRRYRSPARRLARVQAAAALISQLPRRFLEVIAFGGIILFVLWLLATREGQINDLIPILGVYALAAARMFPAIQQLFQSLSGISFGRPALDHLHAELTAPSPGDIGSDKGPPPIPLRETLELDQVSFVFPEADRPALDDLSMTIEANTTVGIVGATGAGKTTAVDVILGLLTPQTGALKVDGRPIAGADVRAWRKSVGYVPQDIFLVDDTVAANIAFGIPPERIDRAAVETAARAAELHDFVTAHLPQGYDTHVGERGTRLSGGQRQRIGIARAIYHDPDVLVFDEATSALDNLTEKAVMDAIRTLGQRKTIIMIAHRLSTVRNCDKIFLLERGRLAGADTYDRLLTQNPAFRALHEAAA